MSRGFTYDDLNLLDEFKTTGSALYVTVSNCQHLSGLESVRQPTLHRVGVIVFYWVQGSHFGCVSVAQTFTLLREGSFLLRRLVSMVCHGDGGWTRMIF